MSEISAAAVMKLRKVSGQGMMDCKKALIEADGDMDKALEILRKKGLATLAKRAERDTTEGIVTGKVSDDDQLAVLVTLCCETDFVARSDDFVAVADKLYDYAAACSDDESAEALLDTKIDDTSLRDLITELVSKTGEKIQLGDYARYRLDSPGLLSVYVHFNHKVGTMLHIQTSDENIAASPALKEAANDIAMHITATKPLAIDREGIDPQVLEKERAIFAEQVKDKPPQIVEKIVEGKMKKFYTENCLLDQVFVKDDKKTVQQVLDEAAKSAGGSAKIKRFVRFEVG